METGKTDRRVQYTKRALTSALIDLMRENHISKISVKALCAAADVNRSTFYAHFRNQYDLLAYIEAEALEDLKARLLADGEPRTRNVEKILEYAKENADVFLMLLDESEGGFQRQIMELAHLVDLQMSDQDAAVDADDLEYMYLFAVSGALGMLSHWLKKGTPQSPAEMSELLMSMIQHGVEERALRSCESFRRRARLVSEFRPKHPRQPEPHRSRDRIAHGFSAAVSHSGRESRFRRKINVSPPTRRPDTRRNPSSGFSPSNTDTGIAMQLRPNRDSLPDYVTMTLWIYSLETNRRSTTGERWGRITCAATMRGKRRQDVRDVRSLQASDRPSPREIGVLPDAPCPCARWWAASTSGRERLPCSAAFAPSSPRGRSSTRARAF